MDGRFLIPVWGHHEYVIDVLILFDSFTIFWLLVVIIKESRRAVAVPAAAIAKKVRIVVVIVASSGNGHRILLDQHLWRCGRLLSHGDNIILFDAAIQTRVLLLLRLLFLQLKKRIKGEVRILNKLFQEEARTITLCNVMHIPAANAWCWQCP